jgi:hypothetical protein
MWRLASRCAELARCWPVRMGARVCGHAGWESGADCHVAEDPHTAAREATRGNTVSSRRPRAIRGARGGHSVCVCARARACKCNGLVSVCVYACRQQTGWVGVLALVTLAMTGAGEEVLATTIGARGDVRAVCVRACVRGVHSEQRVVVQLHNVAESRV